MLVRFAALDDRAGSSPLQGSLHLASSEGAAGVSGEVHAVVDHAFLTAGAELAGAAQWCDVLILHLNTKYCRAASDAAGTMLHVRIGKKHDQPLEEAYRVDFAYRVAARTGSYLKVTLSAGEGPLGTSDYRIVLEATPAGEGRTLIRLAYSYAYGLAGRLAMQAYLGTVGRDKVGFTLAGTRGDGQPRYIGGMRGVVERNAMRYFLAIEAFLGALSVAPPARVEKSLRDWFAASERYALQLHEMQRDDYLAMKRREYSRQQPG